MNGRLIPIGGTNPYASHPGFEQNDCEDRHTITRNNAYGSAMSGGFGCLRTGGHCVGHQCPRGRFDANGNIQADTIEVDRVPQELPGFYTKMDIKAMRQAMIKQEQVQSNESSY